MVAEITGNWLFDNYSVMIASAGLAFAVFTTFATWLVRLPSWLEDKLNKNREMLQVALDSHEDRDQRRHEDNIIRLTKLETKLDLVNGKH